MTWEDQPRRQWKCKKINITKSQQRQMLKLKISKLQKYSILHTEKYKLSDSAVICITKANGKQIMEYF